MICIKRLYFVFIFCLFMSPIVVLSQINSDGQANTKKTQAVKSEILRLEEMGRVKAVKGESNWDNLIAENAYMIAYDGTIIVYRRGQSLPAIPLKSFVLSEMIVRVYREEEAVVTGLATVEAETPDKKPYTFQMRFLNVWQKFRDGWKIVVSERTGVKATENMP